MDDKLVYKTAFRVKSAVDPNQSKIIDLAEELMEGVEASFFIVALDKNGHFVKEEAENFNVNIVDDQGNKVQATVQEKVNNYSLTLALTYNALIIELLKYCNMFDFCVDPEFCITLLTTKNDYTNCFTCLTLIDLRKLLFFFFNFDHLAINNTFML